MIRDCPLCRRRVFVGTNGKCPSCRREIGDLDSPDLLEIEVYHDDPVPDCCITCGGAGGCDFRITFGDGKQGARNLASSALGLLSVAATGIGWIQHGGTSVHFAVQVGVCDAQRCRPKVLDFRPIDRAVVLLGHRGYQAALNQMRADRR